MGGKDLKEPKMKHGEGDLHVLKRSQRHSAVERITCDPERPSSGGEVTTERKRSTQ